MSYSYQSARGFKSSRGEGLLSLTQSERESHVFSFTFAKRPQLGTKHESNINSLNPGLVVGLYIFCIQSGGEREEEEEGER